ncbi:restin homolog [Sus scrofa]|uniref:restin homolog n=1 Tax=Sus scrofa TaxID=9823 RepID=UPI000A2B5942|nr:restin homolog [Sus scrofa]
MEAAKCIEKMQHQVQKLEKENAELKDTNKMQAGTIEELQRNPPGPSSLQEAQDRYMEAAKCIEKMQHQVQKLEKENAELKDTNKMQAGTIEELQRNPPGPSSLQEAQDRYMEAAKCIEKMQHQVQKLEKENAELKDTNKMQAGTIEELQRNPPGPSSLQEAQDRYMEAAKCIEKMQHQVQKLEKENAELKDTNKMQAGTIEELQRNPPGPSSLQEAQDRYMEAAKCIEKMQHQVQKLEKENAELKDTNKMQAGTIEELQRNPPGPSSLQEAQDRYMEAAKCIEKMQHQVQKLEKENAELKDTNKMQAGTIEELQRNPPGPSSLQEAQDRYMEAAKCIEKMQHQVQKLEKENAELKDTNKMQAGTIEELQRNPPGPSSLQEAQDRYMEAAKCIEKMQHQVQKLEKENAELKDTNKMQAGTIEELQRNPPGPSSLQEAQDRYMEAAKCIEKMQHQVQKLEKENAELKDTNKMQAGTIEELQRNPPGPSSLQEAQDRYMEAAKCIEKMQHQVQKLEKENAELKDTNKMQAGTIEELQRNPPGPSSLQEAQDRYMEAAKCIEKMQHQVQKLEKENAELKDTNKMQAGTIEELQRNPPGPSSLQEAQDRYMEAAKCIEKSSIKCKK